MRKNFGAKPWSYPPPVLMTGLLEYELGGGVCAFTAGRDVELPWTVVQPHQTHSTLLSSPGGNILRQEH